MSEEIFARKLSIKASGAVCIEGITGCIIMAILLPILNNMSSPFDDTGAPIENTK